MDVLPGDLMVQNAPVLPPPFHPNGQQASFLDAYCLVLNPIRTHLAQPQDLTTLLLLSTIETSIQLTTRPSQDPSPLQNLTPWPHNLA